ncbi:MAG: hypothetical protein ACRD4E_11525, partial [Bryobacteraceae bacterium]
GASLGKLGAIVRHGPAETIVERIVAAALAAKVDVPIAVPAEAGPKEDMKAGLVAAGGGLSKGLPRSN